ncbi:hypothetical protein QFZ30_002479 [Arthrobacter pascens]|uniref:hypothetical protein n=1 Tax=Arthrobacter pascens TaxID=1677 RepID=UPI00278CC471|nr:hypothetical protein [Arthrobacter pascens]MDQ0679097.1 hypothetical protein [Arthrobacter pascens]
MPTNQEKLDGIHWHNTPEGREFATRHMFSEITFPNAWGDKFPLLTIINGVERRVAEQNAQITALTAALSASTANPAITPELITEAIKEAIGKFQITLTAGGDK